MAVHDGASDRGRGYAVALTQQERVKREAFDSEYRQGALPADAGSRTWGLRLHLRQHGLEHGLRRYPGYAAKPGTSPAHARTG